MMSSVNPYLPVISRGSAKRGRMYARFCDERVGDIDLHVLRRVALSLAGQIESILVNSKSLS